MIFNYVTLISQKVLRLSQNREVASFPCYDLLLNISWKKKKIFWPSQVSNYHNFRITGRLIKGILLFYFTHLETFLSQSNTVVALTVKAPFMLCFNFRNVLFCFFYFLYFGGPFCTINVFVVHGRTHKLLQKDTFEAQVIYWFYKRR